MYDFLFDGELLSDHGFMICSFSNSDRQWSGGDITFTTGKAPNTDKQNFYTSVYDTPLSCTFSICKRVCNHEHYELTSEEQSNIVRWLCREDGYHWMQFDIPEYEDVYFNVYFTATPYLFNNKVIGFDLTMTTDSPYGYSKLMTKQFTLTNEAPKIIFQNYSDKIGNISPKCTIIPKNNGSLIIKSGINGSYNITEIENVIKATIVLDKDNDFFSGFDYNNFNFKFPIISNSYRDRNTYFEKISGVDFDMKVEYRLIRKVIV